MCDSKRFKVVFARETKLKLIGTKCIRTFYSTLVKVAKCFMSHFLTLLKVNNNFWSECVIGKNWLQHPSCQDCPKWYAWKSRWFSQHWCSKKMVTHTYKHSHTHTHSPFKALSTFLAYYRKHFKHFLNFWYTVIVSQYTIWKDAFPLHLMQYHDDFKTWSK